MYPPSVGNLKFAAASSFRSACRWLSRSRCIARPNPKIFIDFPFRREKGLPTGKPLKLLAVQLAAVFIPTSADLAGIAVSIGRNAKKAIGNFTAFVCRVRFGVRNEAAGALPPLPLRQFWVSPQQLRRDPCR